MFDNPWYCGVEPTKHTCYQPVVYYTYWPMLGSFKNWNIIQFTNNTTSSERFDEVHTVVLDVISENMASLVNLGKYGTINAADPTTI